jgi:hypothetical protein
VDVGAGLRVSCSWLARVGNQPAARMDATPEEMVLELPAGACCWLQCEVEAIRPGAGSIVVRAFTEGRRRSASAGYEVTEAEPGGGGHPDLSITRTVEVASPGSDAEAGRGPAGRERAPDRHWRRLQSGDRLAAGQLLRVTERIEVGKRVGPLVWRQRVPAVCERSAFQPAAPASFGTVQSGERSDVLTRRVAALPPGQYTHDYLLVAVRPGVARLAVPQLTCGNTTVSVRIEPEEFVLSLPLESAGRAETDERQMRAGNDRER